MFGVFQEGMNEFKRDVYYFRGKLFRKQSFIAGYPDGHRAVHGAVSCGIVVGWYIDQRVGFKIK